MSDDIAYLFDTETADMVAMDAVKRAELLDGVETLGMVKAAAAQIGMSLDMVSDALAKDSRLEADLAIAQGKYEANLLTRMAHLAFNGSEKAIVGGKNKDEILGVDVVPNDKALELLAKMKFADELAMVTRQRITAEVSAAGKDEMKADFSQLTGKERKEMVVLLEKAKVKKVVGAEEKS